MSSILRFTRRFIVTFSIVVLVSSVTFTASAQVNTERGTTPSIAPSQAQTVEAAIPIGPNLIQDSHFDAWPYESSPWKHTGTASLCTASDPGCQVSGIGYNTEFGWAWLGGGTNTFSDLAQAVTFPKCGAQLEFNLYIGRVDPGSGASNAFLVEIDSEASIVFEWNATKVNSYQPYKHVTIDVSPYADGLPHYVVFYSFNPATSVYYSVDDVALYATDFNPSSGCAEIAVKTKDTTQGPYGIPQNAGDRKSFQMSDGPVFVNDTVNSTVPFVASERVVYLSNGNPTSFSELMGLPQNLVSNRYSFPAYDNLNFNSQLRFANITTNQTATVRVYINGNEMTSGGTSTPSKPYPYVLVPGESLRVSYQAPNGVGMNGGPLVVQSTGGNIVAALRVVPNVYNGSFSEIMGLPQSQVGTTYFFPWYNFASLNTQLRIGNVGSSPATVRIYIGGAEKTSGCTTVPPKSYPYSLDPGKAVRVSCPEVNDGPVRVVSTNSVSIVASERVAYLNNSNAGIRFSELMGLPSGQLSTSYVLPWYNDKELDTQLRFGNVSGSPATVHVYIGGLEITNGCFADGQSSGSPYTLGVGASLRVSCPGVNNGPVKIVSDNGNIIASERVVINNGSAGISFSELMGLPQSQLTTGYVFPWYNNLTLNTQLRFGVP